MLCVSGFGLCYGLLCGIWAVLRILFCALGFGVVLGGASCFGLYLGFRRGFGRCFVFGIVLWIIVFVLGGALCIAGLVLGGSVFCNFCCIDFWIRETLPNYFTGIFWEILFSMRETLPPKLYDGFWWCSIGWILLGWLVHVIFFGMDYSTILLVGLLNIFCDGVLLWFMMIGRCCGFVFVLVDWFFLVWVMSWLLWFICLMFLWYCYDFLLNDVFEVWFYEIVMKWWLEDVLERLSWEIVLIFLLNEVLEWCFFEIVMKWWWKCREGCRVMMMMGRWARPTLTYIYIYNGA